MSTKTARKPLNCPSKTINHVVSSTVSSSPSSYWSCHHDCLVIVFVFVFVILIYLSQRQVIWLTHASTVSTKKKMSWNKIMWALLHLVLLLVTISLHRCAVVTNYSGEAGGEAQCNTTLWSLKHKHTMVNKHKHSTLDIKHKNNMLVTEKHKHSGHWNTNTLVTYTQTQHFDQIDILQRSSFALSMTISVMPARSEMRLS